MDETVNMTARPQDVALLPCPFCGGRAKSKSEFVRCVECGAQMNFGDEDGLDSIISSWNRRSDAALASAQAREEELRAEVAKAQASVRFGLATQDELRALLGGVECQRDANWQAYTEAEARAKRLAEALREMLEAVAGKRAGDEPDVYADYDRLCALVGQARAALSTNAATQTGERT